MFLAGVVIQLFLVTATFNRMQFLKLAIVSVALAPFQQAYFKLVVKRGY